MPCKSALLKLFASRSPLWVIRVVSSVRQPCQVCPRPFEQSEQYNGRIAAGLSRAELAERTGVDRAYVSGLEIGQRNPAR